MGWLESPMTFIWLVYFSIAELLSFMPSQAAACILISEEASAENYSGNYACASMHEAIFRFVRFIWENASHDNVVAFGTITVSVFTYTLWRSTNKLWDAAKEQARITENGFAQLEGPVIEASNLTLDWIQGPIRVDDKPPIVNIWLKNRGRGPGFIVRACGHFVLLPGGRIPTEPPYREIRISNMALGAGEQTDHALQFPLEVPRSEEGATIHGGTFFYGFVEYRGVFGGVSTWAWGFSPNAQTARFTVAGGTKYNYRKYEPDRKG
jgi:hypothetical protein